MKLSINYNELGQWVAAILIFLQIEPYFVWPLHSYIVYYNTVPFLLIIGAHCRFDRFSVLEGFFLSIAVLSAVCARYNIIGIGMSALFVLIFLCDKKYLIEVFNKFRNIYVILIAISMIVWLLVSLGVSLPYRTIPPLNSGKNIMVNAYPFLVKISPLSMSVDSLSNSVRFMGLFDEPGVVGTVSLMMLFVGKFDISKKYNIILLISGILSFSLFFYIACFVFLMYNVIVLSNYNKKYRFIVIILLFAGLYYSFQNATSYELIWKRLEWDASRSTITGNNRSGDELDDYVEQIKGTDAYYWGVGNKEVGERFSSAASIKNAILRYGVVVLVLFFLFYYFYSCRYIKSFWMRLVFVAFLYMTLYQRPSFFVIHYLFLFTLSVYAYSDQYGRLFLKETKLQN